MAMELLRELAALQLPVTITKVEHVDMVRVLRASGHIACTMSAPGSGEPFARVLAITREGRAALALENLMDQRRQAGY